MNSEAVANDLNKELASLCKANAIDYQWDGQVATLIDGIATCTVRVEPAGGESVERIDCEIVATKSDSESVTQFAKFTPSKDGSVLALSTNSVVGNKKDLDSVNECASLILQILDLATRI